MVKRAQRARLVPALVVSLVLLGLTALPAAAGNPLSVTGLNPATGPTVGGTNVLVTGTGFLNGVNSVKFGLTAATNVVVVNDSQLTADSPFHVRGVVDVTVSNTFSTSPITASDQFTYAPLKWYFTWYDSASPGMLADNIHLLNTSAGATDITVSMPGATTIPVTLASGAETYVSFGAGHIGGPVVVSSDRQILTAKRVQYYQTFNEVWGQAAGLAQLTTLFSWYDNASAGMAANNIHIVNPGTMSSDVTMTLGPTGPPSTMVTVPGGAQAYLHFPAGTIGGPVVVKGTQPVMASQRVQYYSSFNEVWGRDASQAATNLYLNWYDIASSGMLGDKIHLLNPNSGSNTVTVTVHGFPPVIKVLATGEESYVTFPAGTIGGEVSISGTLSVLASQRVQYYSSFNEVWAQSAVQAGQTDSFFNWYDKASPGMLNDNIHLFNTSALPAIVTVHIPGATDQVKTIAAFTEDYVTFPASTIGGPVHVTSTQPVMASQRVQYYRSFNEIWSA